MIKGSCLCGAVQFEISRAVGPFEICHCNRCRKVSGSNGMAALGILKEDFRFLEGQKFIQSYQAPLIYDGPPYETSFCSMCGSPTPPLEPGEFFEVPAGLLDDDPKLKPDKHIFVEFTPEWDTISGELPQFTLKQLYELRHGRSLPEGFSTKTHYESTPKE